MLSEKKVANLADAFKLLELKPQEALQVKFYILNPTGKKTQELLHVTKHMVYGGIAAQVLMAPSCLFPCSVLWILKKCKTESTSAVIYLDFSHLEDSDLSSEI